MKKNAAIILAILLLGVGGATTFVYLRQEPAINRTPIEAEHKRKVLLVVDSIKHKEYCTDTAWKAGEIRALKRKISALEGERKGIEQKARQSALNYNKTPTLANCNQALSDCQEENESVARVIDLQYLMLAGKDVEQQRDRQEIGRLVLLKDSLFSGWQSSNEALKKAGRPKRFGVGITAGYGLSKHGINPVIAVGINYNLARF